jgi:acyl-coenzyme A thioesterase PaaI-like protein
MYKAIFAFLSKYFKQNKLFKILFNISPMYRRTNARLIEVSDDIHYIKIKIALNYKNRNYMGTMFGGSMLSATDPIYMIQLLQILGDDYVVWDKSTNIRFKKPANKTSYAVFEFNPEEIIQIKKSVTQNNEIDLVKTLTIESEDKNVYAVVEKTIYISTKTFYKEKKKKLNRK